MSEPYRRPAPPPPPPQQQDGDRIDWAMYGNRLLIIWPLDFRAAVNTKHGPRDLVHANIAVVETGEWFKNAAVFPYYLVGQLKDAVGGKVLGRLVQQRNGDKTAWVLGEPTPQDEAQAQAFEARGQSAPQQQPAQGQGWGGQQQPHYPPTNQGQQPPYPSGSPYGGQQQYPSNQPAYPAQQPPWQGQQPAQQPQAQPPWGGQT